MHWLVFKVLLLSVFLAALWGGNGIAAHSADECRQLGFQKTRVNCQYCAVLLQHTGNSDIYEECTACCSSDEQEQLHTYLSARIEVNSLHRELQDGRSEIGMFHRDDAAMFGDRLKFSNKRGLFYPRMILKDREGGETEIILTGWTKNSIRDYLQQVFGMNKSK